MKARSLLFAAISLAAAAPALPAAAQETAAQAWTLVQHGGVLPVRAVIAAVRDQLGPGAPIGVPYLSNDGGRPVYHVRWRRVDGVVMDVLVDAQSGRVIG